jgi:subtilisin family serine protease
MSKVKPIPFIDPSLTEQWSLQPAWSQQDGMGSNLSLEANQAEPAAGITGIRTYVVSLERAPLPQNLSATVRALLDDVSQELRPRQLFDQLGAFSIDLGDSQAESLRQVPGIRSVEADRPVPMMPPVSVEPGLSNQDEGTVSLAFKKFLWQKPDRAGQAFNSSYSLEDIGLNATSYGDTTSVSGETLPWGVKAVWNGFDVSSKGNIGVGSTVFVIDSGVLNTTGDLNLNTTWSKSFIAGESAFSDGVGHGTHVAGTIAALANGIGVVGVAPGAQVVSLKVFGNSGGGATITSIIDAINYAVGVINTNGLDRSKVVINMSLGGGISSALSNAIMTAANQGIRFAIAAGNSGQDVDGFSPANAGDHPNVYTVSAVNSAYTMASWSNWDRIDASDSVDDVDLAAPGVGVLSYFQGGKLAYLSGTSMAAPHVAGLLLTDGVKAGTLVTPVLAGTADPFALAGPGVIPTPPTFSLQALASINEGGSLTIAVTTTNIAAGTVLSLQFSGGGISAGDFASGSLTASISTDASGRGSFSTTVLADNLREGNETLLVSLFQANAPDQPVAQASINLIDSPLPPAADRVLWGTTGSDIITGSTGNDRISGVLASGTSTKAMGGSQIDGLTGGSGADVFVLGDTRGVFYDNRINGNLGLGDYARIQDFTSGVDKIQLFSASYLTSASQGNTSLYWDRNGNGKLNLTGSNQDELIAIFTNSSPTSADVVWA